MGINKNGIWTTPVINEIILPNGYAELEYIESTGAQYIDTQIQACTNKIRCVCDMMPLNTSDTAFFGSRGTYYLFYNVGGNYFWPTSKCEFIQGTLTTGNRYYVDWDKGALTIMGDNNVIQKAVRNNSTQDSINMYIFNFNPLDNRGTVARLYYFRIYIDDILRRDFIPCKRISDNAIGLYDLVSKSFFTYTAGTTAFIAGPVIKENAVNAKVLQTNALEAFEFIEK